MGEVAVGLVVLALRAATVAALFLFLGVSLRMLRDELTAAAAAPEAAPDALAGWLEVVAWDGAPERAGRRYPLEATSTIGRATSATVLLADARVSALHARLSLRGGDWWVEDLGSTNGAFVNGRAVAGPARLGPQDTLLLGPATLRVRAL